MALPHLTNCLRNSIAKSAPQTGHNVNNVFMSEIALSAQNREARDSHRLKKSLTDFFSPFPTFHCNNCFTSLLDSLICVTFARMDCCFSKSTEWKKFQLDDFKWNYDSEWGGSLCAIQCSCFCLSFFPFLLLLLHTNRVFSTGGRDYFVIVYFMYYSGPSSFEDSIVKIFASTYRLFQVSNLCDIGWIAVQITTVWEMNKKKQ